MDLSKETFQTQFKSLQADRASTIEAASDIQARYDAKRAEIQKLQAELKPLKEELRDAKAPLVEIDTQIAMISRALQGKTGPIA